MSILNFLSLVYRLKSIPRKGWIEKVSVDALDAESVADHSYFTALLTMLLSDIKGLDTCRAVRLAILHDIAEALVGDHTPEEITHDLKHRMEDKAMRKMLMMLPEGLKAEYERLWREYMDGRSREALLVHEVDKLEMSIQAYEYEKKGYDCSSLKEFYDSAILYVKDEYILGLINNLRKREG